MMITVLDLNSYTVPFDLFYWAWAGKIIHLADIIIKKLQFLPYNEDGDSISLMEAGLILAPWFVLENILGKKSHLCWFCFVSKTPFISTVYNFKIDSFDFNKDHQG